MGRFVEQYIVGVYVIQERIRAKVNNSPLKVNHLYYALKLLDYINP